MYPSSLKDKEWERIKGYFEPEDKRGRKAIHSKKQVVDGILYITKSGCQWRMLPKDFPPWKTVYDHFSRWNKRGVWEAALDEVNKQHRRQKKVVSELRHHRLTK
jgi:putative transposase